MKTILDKLWDTVTEVKNLAVKLPMDSILREECELTYRIAKPIYDVIKDLELHMTEKQIQQTFDDPEVVSKIAQLQKRADAVKEKLTKPTETMFKA